MHTREIELRVQRWNIYGLSVLYSWFIFFNRRYKIAVIFDFAVLHVVVELLFPVNIGNGFLYGGQFFFEFLLLFGQHDFAFGDGVFAGSAGAMSRPITLADQGSFFAGGKVVTAPGVYKDNEPTNFAGETLHGDAESRAQFFYQMTPDTGAFDVQEVADTMEKWLKDKGLSK